VSRHSSHQGDPQLSQSTELQEPIPALVKRNGYEGHIRHRLGFKLIPAAQRPAGPGAVAHMSLHLKPTMSKNQAQRPAPNSKAGQPTIPLLASGGLQSSVMSATSQSRATQWRRPVR